MSFYIRSLCLLQEADEERLRRLAAMGDEAAQVELGRLQRRAGLPSFDWHNAALRWTSPPRTSPRGAYDSDWARVVVKDAPAKGPGALEVDISMRFPSGNSVWLGVSAVFYVSNGQAELYICDADSLRHPPEKHYPPIAAWIWKINLRGVYPTVTEAWLYRRLDEALPMEDD